MFKKLLVLGVIGLVAALLVACGGDDGGGNDSGGGSTGGDGNQQSQATSLDMIDSSYAPNALSVAAGRELTIVVRNQGQQQHTFTIDNVADSGVVEPGEDKNVVFTPSAGTLTFYCIVHGRNQMSGTLTVN